MSTIIQAVWLVLVIIFVFSVITCGFTAKKIDNIHNPTYAKAFLATALKNVTGLAGFFVFGLFFDAPAAVALGVAFGVIPIIVYRIVFASMWREAALIWLVVTVVEGGLFYLATIIGIVSWAVLTGNAPAG